MRVVLQRVSRASVSVPEQGYVSSVGKGLLVLVAFEDGDGIEDIEWTARKIVAMRIFDDENGVMNLSVRDIDGDVLIVSQFTLFASTARGNRPSYVRAAGPDVAVPLYESFMAQVQTQLGKEVAHGIFGADMKVELLNDGPVTIMMDSKTKL
ncbi:MAG: D-aminoacyl-tRNA deacylase [Candidatus Cryptobacteroides sp.]